MRPGPIPFRGSFITSAQIEFSGNFSAKKRKKPIKHEQKVLFALKAVPIRIQLFALFPPLLGDIRKRRQKWQITSIKAKQIHSPPTHTHSLRHAQRVPCLKKSTAFRPKETNKRNAKEMAKYFSSSYHILFACVRDGSLIKNANANFNDGVKTNVYCLLSQVKSRRHLGNIDIYSSI